MRRFTNRDIEMMSGEGYNCVRRFTRELELAGILKFIGKVRTLSGSLVKKYILLKDTGPAQPLQPQVDIPGKRSGKATAGKLKTKSYGLKHKHIANSARQRAWTAMLDAGEFTRNEIRQRAEIGKDNSKKYFKALERAGYIAVLGTTRQADGSTCYVYHVVNNTGPIAPAIASRTEVHDLNTDTTTTLDLPPVKAKDKSGKQQARRREDPVDLAAVRRARKALRKPWLKHYQN